MKEDYISHIQYTTYRVLVKEKIMSQYERSKKWKENNKEKVNANQRRYRAENGQRMARLALQKRRAKLIQWFKGYKANLSCKKCDENHPACLVFHHRDPKTKQFQISAAVGRSFGKNTILAEIEKCDVLCANCHAKVHWNGAFARC